MWKVLRGYRLYYILAIVSVAVSALSRTASLLVMRYLVDDVLVSRDVMGKLPAAAGMFALFAVIEGAGLFFKGKLAARASEGAVKRLRNFLFNHIQRLSFSYHDRTDSGNLIERVTSDVDILRKFYSERSVDVGRILTLLGLILLHFCI